MGNYYDENGVYHMIPEDEVLGTGRYAWKGSSTKEGNNRKAIVKRRKKNKNKKLTGDNPQKNL